MKIQLEFLPFLTDGAFFLGISGGKVAVSGVAVDEFTFEPLEGASEQVIGECFTLSIGLFFVSIDLFLHMKFYGSTEDQK